MLVRMYLAAQVPNEECRHRLFNVRYDLKIRFLNDSDVDNVANSLAPIRWPSTVITPKSCQIASKNRLLFMIIVHSSVTNFKQREAMRSTWSNETTRLNFRYVFSTGRSLNVSIQKALEQEAEKYGDILQSYGVDNYKLLPVKAYSWIKFVHESCSHLNPTYIVKIDDDVDVNLYGMQNFLDEFRHVPRSVYCSTFKHIADRRPSSKYFLSTSEFPYRNLGIFCAGLAYTITFDLIPEMYKNVKIKRFVWLDDWYVTHALLHNVDFAIFDTSDLYLVSEEKRDAYRQLRQVLTDERPTPIFSHLRPRTFFTETKQQELWKRSQLCSNYSFLEI
uniref:Hexosyltransferase n=1 Tax=Acrobeloides nanus TaxID=290746 RepID=A0A914EC60_9BILA